MFFQTVELVHDNKSRGSTRKSCCLVAVCVCWFNSCGMCSWCGLKRITTQDQLWVALGGAGGFVEASWDVPGSWAMLRENVSEWDFRKNWNKIKFSEILMLLGPLIIQRNSKLHKHSKLKKMLLFWNRTYLIWHLEVPQPFQPFMISIRIMTDSDLLKNLYLRRLFCEPKIQR